MHGTWVSVARSWVHQTRNNDSQLDSTWSCAEEIRPDRHSVSANLRYPWSPDARVDFHYYHVIGEIID